MKTIRITPSRLDEYRCYLDEEYYGKITKESVVESIKGEKKWTPQASFGTAFGMVVEKGMDEFRVPGKKMLQIQGDMPEKMYLQPSEVVKAQELHDKWKGATFEPWFWINLKISYNLVVNAPFKCDWLFGNGIHELKTTSGKVDLQFYERSLQWRCYLYALKADSVQYHIYPVNRPNKSRKVHIVKEPMEPIFYYYESLESDLRSWFLRYYEFAESQGLTKFLER